MCRSNSLAIVRTTIFLSGILAFVALPAFSQMNTGEIGGIVLDPTGSVVPNATVTAVETGTQLKYATKIEFRGRIPAGPASRRRIQPHCERATDSSRLSQPNVEVHAGEHLRQAFTLELGEQSETLTVSVQPGLLQVESAAIQDTIQQQQVIDLPLKGRDFIDLVGLDARRDDPAGRNARLGAAADWNELRNSRPAQRA